MFSGRRQIGSLWEANKPVISWSEAIVGELGLLSGPAVFVVSCSTEVCSTEDAQIFLVVRRVYSQVDR